MRTGSDLLLTAHGEKIVAEVKQKAKRTKKQRKYGRNAAFCARYRAEFRAEKSQLKRLRKHSEKFPDDHCALGAIGRLEALLYRTRAA